MLDEIFALYNNSTWDVAPLTLVKPVVGSQWIFTISWP